ncbi:MULTISPECIES: trehalose-6-phosphate synthase [Halorussus]|uniref:alpha,alpha-trehalose-phosphate synthase (UDP-forming) n=1 Tax=Halorussus TaxID=1070314 RepID=UPI000E21667B|nr:MULTISPECIES: trehalose-6-phosphate synthase [Halorussus]NHN58748.1 trehalose-6-phosphate synthase [Halorussus sp. JP-T4]
MTGESSPDADGSAPTEGLVVVSNREPYSHSYDGDEITVDRPVGGLTAGLDPVMQRAKGTWVAWGDGDADREVVDEHDRVGVPPEDPAYTLRRIWLDDDEIEEYYYGYSNQVLWPLCHSDRGRITYEPRFWDRYEAVNRRFAEAAAEEADPGSLIWFQDYHFGLAPRMVRRELGDDATLAHFWHIPWPTWDDFRVCPQSRQLMEGLLANDLIGFHVDRFCAQFLEGVDACFDDAAIDWDSGEVHRGDSTTLVKSFPMGVDTERIERLAGSDGAEAFWDRFREERGIADDAVVAVGVDRLDYTKGIPERIRAIEYFLDSHPEFRGEFVYVQKASESRSEIPAYQEIQDEVSETAERVNDRFGTDDWEPVVGVTEMLPAESLYGLYRHADLALVSSVRDGMNLVAEEYVAAQLDNGGALVLSDFAGVDETLGDYAYTINPYATKEFAESIHRAITDDPGKRRERMRHMRQLVTAYDLDAWMDDIFETAAALRDDPTESD